MTLVADSPVTRAPSETPVRTRPRMEWVKAFRALRKLFADKEDTGQVFEIMRALNGTSIAKGYQRLLETPRGGRIAYERQEFAQRLMDDAWLDSFPEGTVGAAYRHFIRSEQLSAEGLAEVSRQNLTEVDAKHPYAWFGRRTRDIHDVWHILSGYHRDALGESCLVAFSYSQTKGLGWAFIAFGAMSRTRGSAWGPRFRKAIWQGFARGKRAAWLLGEDYEALFAEPLESARRRLGITPPTAYEAIPVAYRNGVIPVGA